MSAVLLAEVGGLQKLIDTYTRGDEAQRIFAYVMGGPSGAELDDFLTTNGYAFSALASDGELFAAVAASQVVMDVVAASQVVMDVVAASRVAMDAVAASQTAMTAVAASETAMTAIDAVPRAVVQIMTIPAGLDWTQYADVDAVAASETAMTAVAASETAMTAVAASETAMTAVAVSETAVVALDNSPLALEASSYNSSDIWVSVGDASNGTVIVTAVWWIGGAIGGETELRTALYGDEVVDDTRTIGDLTEWGNEALVGHAFTSLEVRRLGGGTDGKSRNVRYIPVNA